MKSNYDYIKEFIVKHNYSNKVKVQCFKQMEVDNIKHVIFDEIDIPSGRKVNMEDIKYDIDSSLPEDVFYRWLEYVDKINDEAITYIYWMTKMDNRYEPIGIDKSESEKMRHMIYDKLDEMKKMRWF